jgi:RsmE family RNA methyltransferase
VNVVLLEAEDFVADRRVRLEGRRLRHVREVHRAAVGDELRVGLIGGCLGRGRIVALDAEAVELEVELDLEPPPPLPLTLVLALPRPKVLGRVLQACAAMGVKRLLLANARRVEKSFWESPALRPESVRQQLVLGLEQGRDSILPEVTLHPLFRPLVEDALPALAAGTTALVAHPAAAEACPRNLAGRATLAIGPEGGFIPFEIELLAAQGFRPVSLGPRILRVEQAMPALLARLF